MEDEMATKTSKASSGKKLKKVSLKPVKNLTTTQSLLKIDGIKGESTDSSHKDWIE
jgi:type VI protein secretion system component Hcp